MQIEQNTYSIDWQILCLLFSFSLSSSDQSILPKCHATELTSVLRPRIQDIATRKSHTNAQLVVGHVFELKREKNQ
jgi:hypothetical protein